MQPTRLQEFTIPHQFSIPQLLPRTTLTTTTPTSHTIIMAMMQRPFTTRSFWVNSSTSRPSQTGESTNPPFFSFHTVVISPSWPPTAIRPMLAGVACSVPPKCSSAAPFASTRWEETGRFTTSSKSGTMRFSDSAPIILPTLRARIVTLAFTIWLRLVLVTISFLASGTVRRLPVW